MSDVRINLLKEVKSAVNAATFSPSADRIKDAKRMVSHLMSYVESLEAPTRKTTLREAVEMVNGTAARHEIYGTDETKANLEAAKATLRDVEAGLAKRRASKKRKQKAGKATPSTRVADRQERAFHGKADSPVTPSTRKPKASVEEARKSAEAVSRHTGAAERAERKAEAVKEAVSSSHDERVASLEAEVKQLKDTLLVLAESTSHHTANEVCFSQLPFDPTSTL